MNPIPKSQYMGKKKIYLLRVDSTNNFFSKPNSFPEGTLVLTENQTSGRGQRGRKWLSIPYKSLTFSILLKPPSSNYRFIYQLSQVMAMSLCKTIVYLSEKYPLHPMIKWPNDVLLKKKKLAGILIENRQHNQHHFVTLGMGINVNVSQYDFGLDLQYQSTSLYLETQKYWNRKILLTRLLDIFERDYEMWKKGYFKKMIELFKARLSFSDQRVYIKPGKKKITGKAIGIDDEGRLLIKDNEGQVHSIISSPVRCY